MDHTVMALAEKPVDAQRIIDDLTSLCVCDRSDISLVARDDSQQGSGVLSEAARATGQLAAAAGAAAASTLGSMLGAGSRAMTRNVSGFGVLNAFGQLGGMLSRTALATAEDLGKAFKDLGVEGELAREHAEALRQGGILVVVHAKTGKMAECARRVMATHGTVPAQ